MYDKYKVELRHYNQNIFIRIVETATAIRENGKLIVTYFLKSI